MAKCFFFYYNHITEIEYFLIKIREIIAWNTCKTTCFLGYTGRIKFSRQKVLTTCKFCEDYSYFNDTTVYLEINLAPGVWVYEGLKNPCDRIFLLTSCQHLIHK